LTVAGVVVDTPVMLLTMSTVQFTVPPPPLPDPLHWVTEVANWLDPVDHGMQVKPAFAAPLHDVPVTVELVTPVERFRLFVTVTVHDTAWPPTLSTPLHWLIAGVVTPKALPFGGPRNTINNTPRTMAKRPAVSVDRALTTDALLDGSGAPTVAVASERTFMSGLLF